MDYLLVSIIKTLIVAPALLATLAYIVWVERKVIAHVQLRVGPYFVGPHGLLQPIADAVKLLTKEDFIPSGVNHFFYWAAPWLGLMFAVSGIAVIPFGPQVDIFGTKVNLGLADINIGLLWILGLAGMGVYGIALAGWSSNNKYSLIGAMRSSAQMISYELPMALALAAPLLLSNSLNLREVIDTQAGFVFGFIPNWNLFTGFQVIGFVLYMICAFAETNRIPFDLPEAENELVAGFHSEYSSMKFAAFFMAEYCNMIIVCSVATALFLGGWHPIVPQAIADFVPTLLFGGSAAVLFYHGMNNARPNDRYSFPVFGVIFAGLALLFLIPGLGPILNSLFWFLGKVGFLLFFFIWVRATLPRFRYDQLMKIAWLFLFPVALANLVLTAFGVTFFSK
ncbi:MAG: NADH-quinone oxidoreductase subunit NuoH [Bryobacterales bacterium]|nr:NADH-quinone oxidoreductase subunit NuoH [Bryobacterales bacterium]